MRVVVNAYLKGVAARRDGHTLICNHMGGSRKDLPAPPPVNIPKPKLEDVPDLMKQEAFNPDIYSEAAREAAQNAYKLQGNAINLFNERAKEVQAVNDQRMAAYNQQVQQAEAQRQQMIAAGRGKGPKYSKGLTAGVAGLGAVTGFGALPAGYIAHRLQK